MHRKTYCQLHECYFIDILLIYEFSESCVELEEEQRTTKQEKPRDKEREIQTQKGTEG